MLSLIRLSIVIGDMFIIGVLSSLLTKNWVIVVVTMLLIGYFSWKYSKVYPQKHCIK